ncbi:MAG: GNAT family N-acetyltransferase [Verrucomicrobia bacterium]|nr:GNAT family N-acetyltransferase [Verrucomicrobiota bacterium]
MQANLNHLGQPVGEPLPDWQPPALPPHTPLQGRYCRLEPLAAEKHATDLFAANQHDAKGRSWTYLPYGPFATFADYEAWIRLSATGTDPQFYAIIDQPSGRAMGIASYLRISPKVGTIEVGHLNFSPLLQGTRAATEAMFLMMERAFALGYRRYEWKCNALNQPSRRAALRLGFTFEGIFRQAVVVKGRNRDTAWFSIIDREWPALRSAFVRWLAPENFDAQGRQRVALSALTAALSVPS